MIKYRIISLLIMILILGFLAKPYPITGCWFFMAVGNIQRTQKSCPKNSNVRPQQEDTLNLKHFHHLWGMEAIKCFCNESRYIFSPPEHRICRLVHVLAHLTPSVPFLNTIPIGFKIKQFFHLKFSIFCTNFFNKELSNTWVQH